MPKRNLTKADVAEEYDFSDTEFDAEDFEGFDEAPETLSEEEAEDEMEMEVEAAEFEGFDDDGEPSTFDFHIHNDEPVYTIDFLEGTEIMASGAGDDRSLLIDARQLDVLADLGSAGDSVISAKFCAMAEGDQALLATASMDGLIRVHSSDPQEGIVLLETLDAGEGGECCWIDWHPRGTVLIGGFSTGSVWMWKIVPGGAVGERAHVMAVFVAPAADVPICTGRFSADGKSVIAGGADGSVYILSPRDKLACVARHTPAPHHSLPMGEVTCMAPHPQSPLVMVGDAHGHVKVFKGPATAATDGQITQMPVPLFELSQGHVDGMSIEAVAFHPSGQFALSAGMDGRVLFYDSGIAFALRCRFDWMSHVPTGVPPELHEKLMLGEGAVLAKWLSALPNGPTLPASMQFAVLVASNRGRLALVDGRTGAVLRRLKGRLGVPVLAGSLSAGGILAVAFDDGVISEYQL